MTLGFDDLALLGDDRLAQSVTGSEMVEPIDSPITVPDVMRRFPEQVYQQGVDTHLYRLIQALCGEAGAGVIAKLSYHARLPYEVSLLEFTDLDDFYTTHFNFKRLKSETYDTYEGDFHVSDVWADMRRKDRSYSARLTQYLKSTQLGGTPAGLAMAASAAIGQDVDVIENYKFVYDHFTDDPLGLEPHGRTSSVNEFVLMPEIEQRDGFATDINGDAIHYTSDFRRGAPELNTPMPDATTRQLLPAPVKKMLRAELTLLEGHGHMDVDGEYHHLLPELERNMVQLVDRLRPVGAYMSINPQRSRYISITPKVHATSEHFELARLVTGRSGVRWPDADTARGYFIVEGQERMAPHVGNVRAWPTTFLTVDSAIAYGHRALSDDTYGTVRFYSSESSTGRSRQLVWDTQPPPLSKYVSYSYGAATRQQAKLHPPLAAVEGMALLPAHVISVRNTPLDYVSAPR